jgi:hypothetical protein
MNTENLNEDADVPVQPRRATSVPRSAVSGSAGHPKPVRTDAPDPAEYVRNELESATERLRIAESTQNDIMREVLSCRKAVAKWQSLANALDGVADTGVRSPSVKILTP